MLIYIIIGLIVLIAIAGGSIWYFFMRKSSKNEGFLGSMPGAYKIENIFMDADMANRQSMISDNGFVGVAPSLNNFISPRFDANGTRAALRSPLKELYHNGQETSAVPEDPLSSCSQCNNFSVVSDPSTVTVDRLIFANKGSKLRKLADPIRGDIPIVPNASGWFVPAVNPQIDLERGALGILAGENQTTREFNDFMTLVSTNYAPNGQNNANTMHTRLGNHGQDVVVEAF